MILYIPLKLIHRSFMSSGIERACIGKFEIRMNRREAADCAAATAGATVATAAAVPAGTITWWIVITIIADHRIFIVVSATAAVWRPCKKINCEIDAIILMPATVWQIFNMKQRDWKRNSHNYRRLLFKALERVPLPRDFLIDGRCISTFFFNFLKVEMI